MEENQETKICTKCKEVKELSKFNKNNNFKDHYNSICKLCIHNYYYHYKRKTEAKPICKDGNKFCNCCKIEKSFNDFVKYKKSKDGYNSICKNCHKAYLIATIENVKETGRKWQIKNKDKIRKNHVAWLQLNDKEVKRQTHEYSIAHRKEARDRMKYRYDNDPIYRLAIILKSRIKIAFKRSSTERNIKTQQLLVCTFEEVRQHIENQFVEGMNWENHGKGKGQWNIDHIIPVASAKTREELIKLCHYTNLQPLWEEDNKKKSSVHNGVRHKLKKVVK